jgi:hypothetical protein
MGGNFNRVPVDISLMKLQFLTIFRPFLETKRTLYMVAEPVNPDLGCSSQDLEREC